MEMKDDVNFVKNSVYRTKVMQSLKKYPMMPSELARKTGINTNHVSTTLAHLKKHDLVVCINPEVKRGRVYKLTEKGEEVAGKI